MPTKTLNFYRIQLYYRRER